MNERSFTETHRRNNFDFVRLLFAACVIVTHAYPLAGSQECDWLCQTSHGQYTFSWIAVRGFFVISGYLIFQSLERSKNLVDYYWKRVLRLYPALVVVLTLTVLLGPLVYHSEIPYWSNESVKSYIPKNLGLYHLQFAITGIFEQNPHKYAINGSLWTIAFEFTMYVAVSAFFFIKGKRTIVLVIVSLIYLTLAKLAVFNFAEIQQWNFFILDWYLIELGVYFAAGSLLAVLRIQQLPVRYLAVIFVVSLALFIFATGRSEFLIVSVTMLPLSILCGCLCPVVGISSISKYIGDLSYGMYIYGFPVQQTLVYYFKLDHVGLMIGGLMISALFAYASWHLIEAPALKWKKINLWKNKKSLAEVPHQM